MKNIYLLIFCLVLLACKNETPTEESSTTNVENTNKYQTTGSIERLDPKLDALIAKNAQLEIIAEGHLWTEGPLWIADRQMLLYTDIPQNSIFQWTEAGGAQLYLKPSGFTGESVKGGEPGANGLLLDSQKRLVMCQHGDRRMARMNAPIAQPLPEFISLAENYDGKRFNSPNDAVFKSNGDLYFTDPPYGLEKNVDDPAKELPYQGVFRVNPSGEVTLLTDELSRPNGIAFSLDEKILYVANSDPERAIWMAYDVREDGLIENGRVFYNVTDKVATEKGLPDGMELDEAGNLYATGPGGVWVFSPEGKPLGLVRTGQATSNCAFNEDKSALYITAHMYVLRLKLK